MGTKFADFLQEKKIDPRRVLVASRLVERLRPEDRAIRLKHRQARSSEDAKKDTSLPKPRSGRPVTDRALQAAMGGKELSGAARTRLLRAVNRVLEQKKQEPVELRALFDLPTKGGKKSAEAASE